MIRRPPRSTQSRSSAASDVYKRQVRESFVQTGAIFPGHALVRGELDEHVTETEAVPPGACDQPLPLERFEVTVDERVRFVREQHRQRLQAGLGSDDGRV